MQPKPNLSWVKRRVRAYERYLFAQEVPHIPEYHSRRSLIELVFDDYYMFMPRQKPSANYEKE
jgi:hypothetical protein